MDNAAGRHVPDAGAFSATPSSSFVSGDLGEDGRGCRYSRLSSAPTRSLQGDRHVLESVIGMAESLIGMHRNP